MTRASKILGALAIGCALALNSPARAYNPDWLGTWTRLRSIQEATLLYCQEKGDLPRTDAASSWWEKLVATEWVWESAPVDRWGNAYVYDPDVVDQNGFPLVRSVGANGIDEGGAGDDLTAGRPVNDGWYWKKNWPQARRLGTWWGLGFLGVVLPLLVLVRQVRRVWWSVVLVYACAAAIYVCPLTATPFHIWTYNPAPLARLAYDSAWFVGPIAVVAQVAVLWVRWARERRAYRVGRCTTCGYDLRGLAGERCPECGQAAATERNETA